MHQQTWPRGGHRGVAIIASILALLASVQQSVGAQQAATNQDTTAQHKRLFTKTDALIAAGFAATTVAFFPLDKQAARELRNPNTQANRFFKDASTGVEYIASPGSYVIGGTLYAVGRLGRFSRVADLGWHGSEAVLMAQTITVVLKGTLGRARPFVSRDTNPSDFRFGAGFGNGNRSSFPSGHTSTAFAAAAAVTAETSNWWPGSAKYIGPLMYGGATLVGLSRMYHDRHWGSDVALGAAIGTFSGRKIVQYTHTHPGNRIDRLMLRTTVIPTLDGGAAVAVSIPLP